MKHDESLTGEHSEVPVSELLFKRITEIRSFPIITGAGVTINAACTTVEAKKNLARQTETRFVDMESYWIGSVAQKLNIPFIVVRPVFDSLNFDLTPIENIFKKGEFSFSRAVSYSLLHPHKIGTLLEYSNVFKLISKNMTSFMRECITQL